MGVNVPHVARTNLSLCGWTESYNGVKKVGQLPQQHELHSEAHQEAQVVQEATERILVQTSRIIPSTRRQREMVDGAQAHTSSMLLSLWLSPGLKVLTIALKKISGDSATFLKLSDIRADQRAQCTRLCCSFCIYQQQATKLCKWHLVFVWSRLINGNASFELASYSSQLCMTYRMKPARDGFGTISMEQPTIHRKSTFMALIMDQDASSGDKYRPLALISTCVRLFVCPGVPQTPAYTVFLILGTSVLLSMLVAGVPHLTPPMVLRMLVLKSALSKTNCINPSVGVLSGFNESERRQFSYETASV